MRPGEALSEPMEKDAFLDYELMIYICEGTEAEELEWFQVINIASEPLSAQELRNAIYSGTWLTSAKEYFSKPNSGGKKIGDKYLTADWNRQGGLEVALKWVSHDDIIGYMSEHAGTEEDGTPLYENAEDLYNKFEEIIKWVKRVFPNYRKAYPLSRSSRTWSMSASMRIERSAIDW